MSAPEFNLDYATSSKHGVTPADLGAFSWADFKTIRVWQAAHGLTPDGKFGPASVAAYRAEYPAPVLTSDTIPIFGQLVTVPGVAQVIYHPGVLTGRVRKPGTTANSVILHQSVSGDGNDNGHATDELEKILSRKGYGVDLAIDGDGTLVCYRDLGMECSAHGNERNTTSVGIEILNPYARVDPPMWTSMIDPSPTAWKGREVADTEAQMVTLEAVVRFLTSRVWDGPDGRTLAIPLAWPTTPIGKPARSSPLWFDIKTGGVIAHGHRPSRKPDGTPVQAHSDARRTAWMLRRRMEGAA